MRDLKTIVMDLETMETKLYACLQMPTSDMKMNTLVEVILTSRHTLQSINESIAKSRLSTDHLSIVRAANMLRFQSHCLKQISTATKTIAQMTRERAQNSTRLSSYRRSEPHTA